MSDAEGCAATIVAALVASGVREVVLAPGSRSAPLAYALYAAEQAGVVHLHVRIDERSAGFLALGLAKALEAPVVVVTTSGTAAANLYPAVLEAAHSGLPLVSVTADRPATMIHTGANQTTDQARLFGVHARGFASLDDIASRDEAWRFQITRLVALATGVRSRQPGPVQLNVAFSAPLAPTALPTTLAPSRPAPIVVGAATAEPTPLTAGPRTVIVAADGTPGEGRAIARLALEARLPLLAEPSSNARRGAAAVSTYRILLGTRLAAEVERVVVFGRPTLSRAVGLLLGRADVELVIVTGRADWIAPGRSPAKVCDAVEIEPDDSGWLHEWQQADAVVRSRLDDLLATQPGLTGPGLAARLWSAAAGYGSLVVGSSSPVRDLDLATLRADPPDVYANRGLSGIDGTVSTALGIALGTGRPTQALLGDLTFLHDANGLIMGRDEPRPDLRLVVANDNGGSIFATLEHGQPALAAAFERLFGTPHDADLSALARAFGVGHQRVESIAELEAVLMSPIQGLELVEALVDRASRRLLDAEITRLGATL